MKQNKMQKFLVISIFIIVHLIITRFVVRFIDTTVQIDNDYFLLAICILAVNILLLFVFRKIYKFKYK